jgi:deoxycytidine triphosphate deaminase
MSKLLNFKDIQTLRDKKISIVLRKFIKTKLGSQEQISEVTLSKYFEFIKNIESGFVKFKNSEEEQLLFGRGD